MFRRFFKSFRRLLRFAARPVRRDRGEGGLYVQPYRGYGSREQMYVMGRVFRQIGRGSVSPAGSLLRDLIDLVRRLFRYGVPDVELIVTYGDEEFRVTTDKDGYFRLHLFPERLQEPDKVWQHLEIEAVSEKLKGGTAPARAFVAPPSARQVVISDIDDTVMLTGVANKTRMLWRLFMEGAKSRTAFPGVAPLYRALHDGAGGEECNPMLYVSRGPWSIYEMLETFFNLHHIPEGPVLFLREWGLTVQRPLPRKSPGHKLELIEEMLACYHDLPFILIGDSGQHDPRIYAEIVRRYPGRVQAIYIRNVTKSEDRLDAIEELALELEKAGSPLVLAADSLAMAEHAARAGFIAPDRLDEIRRSLAGDLESPPSAGTTGRVNRQSLRRTVREGGKGDTPPNVEVEPGSG